MWKKLARLRRFIRCSLGVGGFIHRSSPALKLLRVNFSVGGKLRARLDSGESWWAMPVGVPQKTLREFDNIDNFYYFSNMVKRKIPLVKGQVYYIYNKSIARFTIFKSPKDYKRMVDILGYYRAKNPPVKFSRFLQNKTQGSQEKHLPTVQEENKIVKIVAFCIMPTHIHLILQQIEENGISTYIRKVLDSYSKFFNIKYNRNGPLWVKRFSNAFLKKNEQILHLTRYIHLNPTTDYLVKKPEDWKFSSYGEYIKEKAEKICEFKDLLDINPSEYKLFVEQRINFQRESSQIKHLLLD
jgi:putative transposase